jgi:secreted trypsin-like serine protease
MAKTLTFLPAVRSMMLALLCTAAALPAQAQSGNPQRDRVMAYQAERAARLGVPFVSGTQPSQIQVLVGTQDLENGGRRVDVSRITRHPSYNPRTSDSDVAVLRLAEAVNDIAPVEFITSLADEAQFAPTGRTSFGMGWGETETTPHFPSVLYNVKVPIVDREICNSADSYDGRITDTMLCAGLAEGGKDTCQGDSGGPLVVKNADKAFHLQVGVVSWGFGCADPDHYGIYSRMATLGAWVKGQVKKP